MIGYQVVDQDYWVLKFKTHGSREFQCLMFIEIKTFGAEPSDQQNELLWIIDQLMRNRRDTSTKKSRLQAPSNVTDVFSQRLQRKVKLKAFGKHVLKFSHLGPDDSDWIQWDGKIIDQYMLTRVLRFDVDPDTLKPLDLRNHHKTPENQILPLNLVPSARDAPERAA